MQLSMHKGAGLFFCLIQFNFIVIASNDFHSVTDKIDAICLNLLETQQ